MQHYTGKVSEIRLAADGQQRLAVEVPPAAFPLPGQYTLAHNPNDPSAPLGTPLFLSKRDEQTFTAAPPFPKTWRPGTPLKLFGPLGKGFQRPLQATRLALIGLDSHIGRLESLLYESSLEIAIFSDAALPSLPMQVEANPLSEFNSALGWADLLYFDVPLAKLGDLHAILTDHAPTSESQMLVHAPMPCAGLAECGVCAVPLNTQKKWAYACEHGPVFPLKSIKLDR